MCVDFFRIFVIYSEKGGGGGCIITNFKFEKQMTDEDL